MSKKGDNPFAALSGSGERDARKLAKQSGGAGKQQHQKQQKQHSSASQQAGKSVGSGSRSRQHSVSEPDSPRWLEAALAQIAEAEARQAAAAADEPADDPWGAASAACAASPSQAWGVPGSSFCSTRHDSSSDDEELLFPRAQQQQQQRQHSSGTSRSRGGSTPASSGFSSPQQQQQWQQWPGAASPLAASSREDSAAAWRSFAMAFAANASAAGDHAAAEDAAGFAQQAEDSWAASEPFGVCAAASLLWCDAATASIMEAAAVEAEAAGLSPMEVLMAQQNALLQEAQAAGGSGRASSSQAQPWLSAAAAPLRSGPRQPAEATPPRSPAAAAARPHQRDAFPALASSLLSPLQPAKSPHSVPHGWRGGRSAPKAKGVRVLNSSFSGDSCSVRPSQQDLHYGLMIDGLKLKDECPFEAAGAAGGAQLFGTDAATAEATRQLLAEQAAAEGRLSAAGARDSCSQEAIRSRMDRTGRSRQNAAADGTGFDPVVYATGNKVVGREWSDLFGYAMSTGWVPIGGRDGGGGTHHKLRRTLPRSGTVQTCMVPSSSSDAIRGIKNSAAMLRRYDKELTAELEAATQADAQAAGDSSSSSRVAGRHR